MNIIIKRENFINSSEVDEGNATYENSAIKKEKEQKNQVPSQKNKLKGCEPSDTMEQICMNHVSCCGEEGSIKRENHACYCDHPITRSCVEGYNKCKEHLEKSTSYMKWIGKQKIEDMCSESLGLCCKRFGDIDISKVEFKKKDNDKAIIKLNPFCALGAKKDVVKNCKKMCATYQGCKGYTADRLGCTLFDEIDIFDPSKVKLGLGKRAPDPNKSIEVNGKSYNPHDIHLKL